MGFIQWFTRLLAAGTLAGVLALAAVVAGARAQQADEERRWYAELEAIREARRDAFASTILSVGPLQPAMGARSQTVVNCAFSATEIWSR